MKTCNKDCCKCRSLNTNTDDKGYPYSYTCLKYEDTVFQKDFQNTKKFKEI